MSKVVSKIANDMSLVQIQLKLIENLKKTGFLNEASKLSNVDVNLKKFNLLESGESIEKEEAVST